MPPAVYINSANFIVVDGMMKIILCEQEKMKSPDGTDQVVNVARSVVIMMPGFFENFVTAASGLLAKSHEAPAIVVASETLQ
jgi:hypothetical protein